MDNKEETLESKALNVIILLNSIEEQFNKVEVNLKRLLEISVSTNNSSLENTVLKKLETLNCLTLKIRQARLNLVFYMI